MTLRSRLAAWLDVVALDALLVVGDWLRAEAADQKWPVVERNGPEEARHGVETGSAPSGAPEARHGAATPDSDGSLSVTEIGMPLALALTSARPRCVSCGQEVSVTVIAAEGATGETVARRIETACTTMGCPRTVEAIGFDDAASVSMLDAAIVSRLRPVVFGGAS